jgi:putative ABC transport system ATP-binding protein
MLRFDSATKVFERRGAVTRALDGLDLAVVAGEFIAVVGPSGSGKSTLLHLAAALDIPTSGRVRIDGRDTAELSEPERTFLRRTRIGLVFQFFNLLPTLSVERNIALPRLLEGRRWRDLRQSVGDMLERIGLSDRRGSLPDELSGGEMQRVAIARALICDPALLLADEPTGNLDSATGGEIMTLIEETARRNGRTTLLVTHDAGVARRAERIVTLRDGRVESDHSSAHRAEAGIA